MRLFPGDLVKLSKIAGKSRELRSSLALSSINENSSLTGKLLLDHIGIVVTLNRNSSVSAYVLTDTGSGWISVAELELLQTNQKR